MSQPERPAALERLDALVGTWTIDGSHPDLPSMHVEGREEVEWTEDGKFLVVRATAEPPEFPDSTSIIGCDGTEEAYSVLYSDSRGVFRIYEMSLGAGVWKQWRDASDPFPQRFIGELSDDGNTIEARWEKAEDGSTWELDFNFDVHKGGLVNGHDVPGRDQRILEEPGVDEACG
jgi:hypothetical protein